MELKRSQMNQSYKNIYLVWWQIAWCNLLFRTWSTGGTAAPPCRSHPWSVPSIRSDHTGTEAAAVCQTRTTEFKTRSPAPPQHCFHDVLWTFFFPLHIYLWGEIVTICTLTISKERTQKSCIAIFLSQTSLCRVLQLPHREKQVRYAFLFFAPQLRPNTNNKYKRFYLQLDL